MERQETQASGQNEDIQTALAQDAAPFAADDHTEARDIGVVIMSHGTIDFVIPLIGLLALDELEFTEVFGDIVIANPGIANNTVLRVRQGIVKNIYYDPLEAVTSLIFGSYSLNQATRNGMGVTFLGDDCHIHKGGKLIGSAPKVNNNYVLSVSQSTTKIAVLIQENIRALATSLLFNEEAVEL